MFVLLVVCVVLGAIAGLTEFGYLVDIGIVVLILLAVTGGVASAFHKRR
jgi:hypothetical protein